jgi:predicted DCC family thiol-disulfide oxidoreductase YuxK
MADRAAPSVVLFDGVCNFCNASVRFVYARDPQGRFRFAPLQSEAAQSLLRGREVGDPMGTVVLIEGEKISTRSAAALRIARGLRGLWPLLYIFIVIPWPLRDWVYNLIARNRYRWFGRTEACQLPTPELAARFLDGGAPRGGGR